MMLSGMRPSSAGSKRTKHPFTPAEKTATYLELFYVMTAAGQKEDAGQVIQEALAELKGTSQEGLILLAQVDYLLNEDDIDGALLKLKSLPVSHPQYIKAREKMVKVDNNYVCILLFNVHHVSSFYRPIYICTNYKMNLFIYNATETLCNINQQYEI